MKKSLHFFASAVFFAGLCVFLSVSGASAAIEPVAYEQAKVELARLRGDEKRAQYRHEWLKTAGVFLSLYEKNPDWVNRAAALFRSAEALEEMARRSFVRKDAQDAAARFEFLASSNPSSVLADDALYRAALVRHQLMRDPKDASALLERIRREYPRSDHAALSGTYLAGIDGGNVASLAPAPVVRPVGVTALVSGIRAQLNTDVVRIVVALDRPAGWTVKYQAPDAGRPSRLVLDLAEAAPAPALKAEERYTTMGLFTRFAVDNTTGKNQTRIFLEFQNLRRYTIKVEKSPFRIILQATSSDTALAEGIRVGTTARTQANSPRQTAPVRAISTSSDVAAQFGLRVRTIIIDPGHGGKDPGTSHNSIVEREVCLDISRRLASVLRAAGYQVILTRERDTWLSLTERSSLAMEKKGDLFISVHVNANTKPEIAGFETYFLDLAGSRDSARLAAVENAGAGRGLGEMEAILANLLLASRTQESRRLAGAVQERVMALLRTRGHPTRDGGSKGAPFHVLIGSSMPGVLVEIGYCTNQAEAKLLRQGKYLDTLAEGIANGIHHYALQLETAGK